MDVAKDGVRIGEEGLPAAPPARAARSAAGGGAAQAGNLGPLNERSTGLVRLTKEAWNTLVEKIKAGELTARR